MSEITGTLARTRGWWTTLLTIGLGAVAGLGQVPFALVPVALAALAGVFVIAARADGWRRAALVGWLAGTGYFAVTLHWIVEPFLIDVARHGWMAPFALLFSATGFSLFWAFGLGLGHALSRPGWSRALAYAVAMTAGEMLRGYILTGFPWAMLGYVWTETPAAQIGALTGPYGLTFLTLLAVALAATLAKRRPMAGGVALLAAWLGPLGLGALLLDPPTQVPPDAPLIRLVQPNARQQDKWDPDRAMEFFTRQLDFTAAPGAPDLTVWPETAIPWAAEPGSLALAEIARAAQGRTVVVGAQRFEGQRAFNSLLVLGPEGQIQTIYDKFHLVPFGEYVPFGQLTRALGLKSMAARDGFGFSPGPGPQLLDLGRAGQALPLICYEAIFPQDLRGTARPGWLLQITNDAWFGTFAGPQQHLAQARMRAIEQGLPMVRAANTGISALIDAQGRMVAQIPLGQAGYLDVRLPAARPMTPYAYSGDLPWALLLGGLGFGLFLMRRRDMD